MCGYIYFFFFSSRRRHTRLQGDWSSDVCSSDLSRPPSVFRGKVAASFGATPGSQGTARSQMSLRICLSAVGVWVVPRTVLIARANEAFDANGELRDPRQVQALTALGRALVQAVRAGLAGV